MSFTLRTDSFCISLNLKIFESDIQYPSNTIMDVEVESEGFSGKASMDIDVKEFAKFAANLYDIYDRLTGEARIAEPYGEQMYISFKGDGRGHIHVNGMLCNIGNILKFENVFDQTYLQDFSYTLKTTYEKYLMKQKCCP